MLGWTAGCVLPEKDALESDSGDAGDTGEPGAANDSDGDGLTDAEESELGTDPSVSDSDGDGESDGEEVGQNTDPLDATDHSYAGGWPIDSCRNSLTSTGNTEGDIVEDFSLMDQYGEWVSLHDFCGHTVLLVGAAFW